MTGVTIAVLADRAGQEIFGGLGSLDPGQVVFLHAAADLAGLEIDDADALVRVALDPVDRSGDGEAAEGEGRAAFVPGADGELRLDDLPAERPLFRLDLGPPVEPLAGRPALDQDGNGPPFPVALGEEGV